MALRAVKALESWIQRRPKSFEAELEVTLRFLLRAQPSMAPFWRLANLVALAVEGKKPRMTLRQGLRSIGRILQVGRQRIGQYLFDALPRRADNLIATYSYSSTVVHALIRARSRILSVYCSEGRPANEGRVMAERLSKAGIQVLFCTDAMLFSNLGYWKHLVVGADAVLPYAIQNKVGTDVIFREAQERRAKIWILADTTKLCPRTMFGLGFHQAGDPADENQIWDHPPNGVFVFGGCFERTKLPARARIVTECGIMQPTELRRYMRRIRVARQLEDVSGLNLVMGKG